MDICLSHELAPIETPLKLAPLKPIELVQTAKLVQSTRLDLPIDIKVETQAKSKPRKKKNERKELKPMSIENLTALLQIQEEGPTTLLIKGNHRLFSVEIQVYRKKAEKNNSQILFFQAPHSSIPETVLSLWGLRKGTNYLMQQLSLYDKNTGSLVEMEARQIGQV